MIFSVQGREKKKRVCDRGRHVSVLCVSKCVVGFTAIPTVDADQVGGGRGFLGLEGSWWSCWAAEENPPKQMRGEPGRGQRRRVFVAVRLYQTDIQILLLRACVYLQQGRLHGLVMEATEGSRGGRGREAWYPGEGEQAGEPAASWRLESTAQTVTHRKTSI